MVKNIILIALVVVCIALGYRIGVQKGSVDAQQVTRSWLDALSAQQSTTPQLNKRHEERNNHHALSPASDQVLSEDEKIFSKAERFVKEADYPNAIAELYTLIVTQSSLQRAARKRIDELITHYEESLIKSGAASELVALYELLITYETPADQYYFKLADYYFSIDAFQQAEYYIAAIETDPYWVVQSQGLLAKMRQSVMSEQNASDIKLKKYKNKYVIVMLVNGFEANFLIDTGASISAIKATQVDALDLTATDTTLKIHTASNTVRSNIYKADSFGVDGYLLKDFSLSELDLPGNGLFDGLLGMDYLKNFDFILDQNDSVLSLRWRK